RWSLMSRVGRPPKPTRLKVLHGDREDRINRDEPIPSDGDVVAPEWLDDRAREIWDRLAPDLIDRGVLTPWDVDAFAVGCDAVARHNEAAELVAEHGVLVVGDKERLVKNPAAQLVRDYAGIAATFLGRFGLTPSDRSRLSVNQDKSPGSGAERLLS